MVSKKTSRPAKSTPPTQPAETTKASLPAANAPKAAAGRAAKKATAAKPARSIVTRRKRASDVASPAPGAVQTAMVVTDEDIRIRAYFLSLEYRGSDRNDVDFWLLAERELRGR